VTLVPSIPLVVRVTQKITDPTTVRLDAGQLQLVEFFGAWSNLSKSMAPVLNRLEAKYSGSIQFTYLDVDNKANSRFKQALGYQFPPHLFLLDGQGKVLQVWKGYVRVKELEEAFAAQGVTP
jgi:thioredoxin-like negative regulator of GroEL